MSELRGKSHRLAAALVLVTAYQLGKAQGWREAERVTTREFYRRLREASEDFARTAALRREVGSESRHWWRRR